MLQRRHVRGESLTEPVIIYCVLSRVGVGPVLTEPCPMTFRWTVETPEDLPYPVLHIRDLAVDGYVSLPVLHCHLTSDLFGKRW